MIGRVRIIAAVPPFAYGDPRRGHSLEYVSFIPALRELGHDVTVFDTLDTSFSIGERSRKLLELVHHVQAEVVFSMLLWHEVPADTLDAVRRAGAVVVNWF